MRGNDVAALIHDVTAAGFFRDSVTAAMERQHLAAADATIFYVVNLLDSFLRADHLFESSDDGLVLKPLAEVYLEATEATNRRTRATLLRRLGDVALFVSGVLPRSFVRRMVGVDYYMAMGGNAYSYLSEIALAGDGDATLRSTFAELSSKFPGFVSVLTEVSQPARTGTDASAVELCEEWFHTGNKAAARQLQQLGILVSEIPQLRQRH